MRGVVLAVCLAAAVSGPARAAESVSVRGAVGCERWRTDRSMESFGARLAEMWVLGYLSGMGVGRQADALKGLDSPAVFAAVDDWCRQHPAASVDDAADALFDRRATGRPR